MLKIKIDQNHVKELYVEAMHIEDAIPRNLRAAVNKTAKTVRVKIAQLLGQHMTLKNNYPPKNIKSAETLKKSIKAKSMASLEKAEAVLGFFGGYPFPLKYFNAKPFFRAAKSKKKKKTSSASGSPAAAKSKPQRIYKGVQYQVKRGGFIRQLNGTLEHGNNEIYFMLPSRKHHVFRRAGKEATPIIKINGPAPGDYYSEIQAIPTAKKVAEERLPIEIKSRVRAILLEKKGIIKLRASRGT